MPEMRSHDKNVRSLDRIGGMEPMSQSDKTSVDQETLRAATTPELHALLKKTFDTSGGSEYERTLCLRIAEELERRGDGGIVDAYAAQGGFHLLNGSIGIEGHLLNTGRTTLVVTG